MNIYSIHFKGHWPVGAVAVVVAPDDQTAARLLEERLKVMGLPQKIEEVVKIPHTYEGVYILLDGDY